MIDIKYERGTYVIDAKIHTEIATSDIAKVQEYFITSCSYEFAEQLKSLISIASSVRPKLKPATIGGK